MGGFHQDAGFAGIDRDELILQFRNKMYKQRAEKIPLQIYSFERTTWKQWKDAHPDTDIYTGDITPPKVPLNAPETSQPNSTPKNKSNLNKNNNANVEDEAEQKSPREAGRPDSPKISDP